MPPKVKGQKKVELSLYINKTAYKFGCACTFCNKVTAILHCPDCPDFFCKDCDVTAHSHKKRADHVRFRMSRLNMAQASGFITRFIRLVRHLRRCIGLARKKIRRYFDKRTLCHYYYNTVYGTTSWRKPYVLRSEELFPFWDVPLAASKIQNVYHLWKSRIKINAKLREYYRKIFDRSRGRFYYAWHGPSKLLPEASWRAPKLCGRRGYPKDILPIYTKDVAAIVIQRKWRAICTWEMLWALTRAAYEQLWDPVLGRFTYLHRTTDVLLLEKPRLLRSQPWDPNYIKDWDLDQVRLFMRRIGLKMYANDLYKYGIDGKTLVLLDEEDFDNLGIMNRVHRRKVEVEVEKRMGVIKRERISEEHMMRREKIRKIKLFNRAALAIQARFRCYLAKKELWLRKELLRLEEFAREVKAEIARSGIWWTMREDVPSKDRLLFSSVNLAKFYADKAEEERRAGIVRQVKAKRSGFSLLKNPLDVLNVPHINMKDFGRLRAHETTQGWGTFSSRGGKFTPVNMSDGLHMENFVGMSNITKLSSVRLRRKGYDARRIAAFLGLAFEIYVPDEGAKASAENKGADDDSEEEVDDEFAEEDEARKKGEMRKRSEAQAKAELDKVHAEKKGRAVV